MSNTVELTLLANDKASAIVNGVSGAVRGLIGQFMAMAGLTAGAAGIGALIKQGIDFNKTMEVSRSGIASLILANNVLSDSFGKALGPAASLNQAFKIAEGVQGDLRKAALTTAASYQELVKGFQTAYGPASAAGITSMSKIQQITISASQAVAALGLDSRQTSQELRALFSGDQGPDNMLARQLEITKPLLDKVRASGEDLGDFLIKKLKPFADVAGASLGNFSTVISNLGDAMDQISGEAFAPLFREIKAQAGGLGGAAGGLSGGLGIIGQGLADSLRALGPLIQAMAALGVTAARAGTAFLSSFAPIVPALTGLTRIVTGLTDLLGTNALALWAAVAAFKALGPMAITASEGLSLFFARMQLASGAANAAGLASIGAAFASLAAPVTAAALAIAAIPAAIAAVVLAGLKLKGMWEESKADEAWERAATAQQTFIEVLERRYKRTIDIAASEELLNMAQSQRALVMDRIIKTDTDTVVSLDDVKSAMAAMTEETMKAKNVGAAFAEMQAKTKEKYQELLATLKAEVRIGGLDGLKKQLAEVAEEFRKKRDEIRKTFFDAGSGQWAQDPKALLGLLGMREGQQLQAAAKEFAKSFKAVPEEITATWETELKKLPDRVRVYYTAAQLQATKTIRVWREELQVEIDKLMNSFVGQDDAKTGIAAGLLMIARDIPTAVESAASAVTGVWQGMARAFDDSFYSVLTGRLDSLKDVFKNLWESILQTFSRYMSDLLQRWIATQMKMGQSGQLKALPGATTYGADGTTTTYTSGGLPQGGYTGAATGAGIGLGVGSLVGQLGNGKYNQTGGMIGGALGGAIGGGSATLGAALGGWAGPIGAIVGALIGTLIGALVSPNTMQHVRGSLGAMMSKKEWIPDEWVRPLLSGGGPRVEGQPWSPPVYGDPEFIKGHWDYGQQARTELEVTGKAILDTQSATFADLFRLGAEEQSRDLLATYRASLKASLTGATFDINAGSSATIQQATEYFTTKLLPRIGLSAAFGQVGYLPTGNQDLPGGVGNISYRTPGMNADGTWTEKKLFSEDSPLFKMMVGIKDASGAYADGLGFTVEKFAELAARISTDDPEKLLAYITGIVGVVVGLRDLGAEMGKTFGELTKGWADEAAAGPTAALAEQAQSIAELFDNLDLYSGDEQLKKAQEAQAASDQLWQSVVSYLQQLDALAEKLSAGLQGMREKMRDFLSPLSEAGAVAATQATIDETWGKLLTATNSGQIEAATNEAAAAIEALFNVLSERVTRGKALIERLTKLDQGLWDIGKGADNGPLAAMAQDMVDIQRKVAGAARLTGLEQIAAMEDVAGSAEEMFGKLSSLLSEIASVSESINKSIDSQIWELGVGEMDPTGQATAITQRIKELQDQLQLATSPAEIQAITSEIQSLTGRYVGQFGKDDKDRAAAIAWAQEELERTRGLANETLELMRKQAEEYANGLQDLIKGSVVTISTNVDEASAAIGQLSQTLSELDRVVREQLERLGTAALDALEPLRTAMEGAAGIFTGATGAAADALSAPETGYNASLDRSSARLDVFSSALDRAVTNLDRLANAGGGAKEAPASKQVAASGSQSRVTAAEVVPLVRRYFGQLTPRVS